MFTSEESFYYKRHFLLEQIGEQGQVKLKNARVLCVGAGGLGSPVLFYLAAAGVGTLGLVDHDVVDITNLHRQILYAVKDVGSAKVQVATERLEHLNPHIKRIPHQLKLTPENVFSTMSDYDIVVDCTDNFSTRYLINDACSYLKKPVVFANISKFKGQCSIFCVEESPCYRCLFNEPPPGLIGNCAEEGVLGVLPGVLGTIQATEVIKLIVGIGEALIGRLLTIDALSMRFKEYKLEKNPDCPLCQHQASFHSLQPPNSNKALLQVPKISPKELKALLANDEVFLIDVREPEEYQVCNLNGYLIPLGELRERLNEIKTDKPIVVHCKSGRRSADAVRILNDNGFKNCRSLSGGILNCNYLERV